MVIMLAPISPEHKGWLKLLAEWRLFHREVLQSDFVRGNSFLRQEKWAESVVLSDRDHFYFIVEEGRLVGYCGIIKIKMISRVGEISILVPEDFQRRGYGTEAVRLLLDLGFNHFNLNCLYADCYTTTDRWRFFEGLGFIREGLLRSRKYYGGKYYDSVIMSMLRTEYDKIIMRF